ncbi:MAG: aspartate/glutamate racemase family protein [Bacillota bacterium]
MKNNNKIIGVVGGMGPDATVDLFKKIINKTDAKKDQDHHRLLIYNNPKIPDRTKAILEDGKSPLKELIKTAKVLENAGADFLIIPCNTAHYFFDELQSEIKIEIVNMIEEIAKKASKQNNIKKLGIMGTKGVIETGIYDKELKNYDIEVLKPSKRDKEKLMDIIYAIKSAKQNKNMQKELFEIAMSLINKGVDGIILGCTELPLLFDKNNFSYPIFISQEVLAESAIRKIEE